MKPIKLKSKVMSIVFKAFLSHSYKSYETNKYFFDIFKEISEVQFEIDEGSKALNVTRIERMINDSDTFIGIYPYMGESSEVLTKKELLAKSKYFRLELDCCIRSRKPAIIFVDKRFKEILQPTRNIFYNTFEMQEVSGTGGFPSIEKHKRAFNNFCEIVNQYKKIENLYGEKTKDKVLLYIPKVSDEYQNELLKNGLLDLLSEYGESNIVILDDNLIYNINFLRTLDDVKLAIIDLNCANSNIIYTYFHANFIPVIRTLYNSNNETNPLFERLSSSIEVGYNKDIIIWSYPDLYLSEMSIKINEIFKSVRRINTHEEASKYFLGARLRKESVFVSYSGSDFDKVETIIKELKLKFQKVFDYKDGKSIQTGKSWITEIFNNITNSNIGIILMSESYVKSGNCMHEAEAMVAKKDMNEIFLLPIKVDELGSEIIPSFLSNLQYTKLNSYKSTSELIEYLITLIDNSK